MLRAALYQQSMLEVDPDEIGLGAASFERNLREVLPELFSPEDFAGLYADDGAGSRCPLQLAAMELLKFRYDVSDAELVQRCARDLGWRYAIGLKKGEQPPGTATLSRFRAKVREKKGDAFIFRRSLQLAVDERLVDDRALQVVDSTNTDCRGAIIDTFNLVAAGIRQVVRKVALALGRRAEQLATEWALQRYLGRSVKGQVDIDWSDEGARNRLITEEIGDVERLVQCVGELKVTLPSEVSEALEFLRKLALQDVEKLPDGTFRIARGTAKDRVISVSDPEARHGRKSSSKVINGFKTHVMGTVDSAFVTGIAVTPAGTHDAQPTADLIRQTEAVDLKPEEALGDNAYGTGENRHRCKQQGVSVLTKLPSPSHKDCLTKREFDVDLQAMQVSCPGGATSTKYTLVKDPAGSVARVPKFVFDQATCQQCPLRNDCSKATREGKGREIVLSVYERELQELKAFNRSPRAKDVLRKRSAVERLLSHLVRMGMRHARFFGLLNVQFQAFMTAAAYNLQRCFTLLASRGNSRPT